MGNGPNPSMHPIPITLVSEFRESAVQKLRFPLEELREVALSEDGMYAALVIRGQIFFTPLLEQLGSRIEQVTGFDGAVRYRHAQFVRSEHPEDPTKILAMSDASGEYEYVLLERLAGADTGGLWNETQLTSGGSIKGVMSYSSVSPDLLARVRRHVGRISVLNLSTTAVNAFEFKTPDGGARRQRRRSVRGDAPEMMGGGGDYEAAPAAAPTEGETERPRGSPARSDARGAGGQGARAVEAPPQAPRVRREARSQFRRDYRLGTSSSAPRAAHPRPAGSTESDHQAQGEGRATTRGTPRPTGGFADLFGRTWAAAGPRRRGRRGGNVRTVMRVCARGGGRLLVDPDGKWLAFSRWTRRSSTVNVWNVETGEVQR